MFIPEEITKEYVLDQIDKVTIGYDKSVKVVLEGSYVLTIKIKSLSDDTENMLSEVLDIVTQFYKFVSSKYHNFEVQGKSVDELIFEYLEKNKETVDEEDKEEEQLVRKVGQKYILENPYTINNLYGLANLGDSRVCLINLATLNRWRTPIEVEDMHNITEKEWERITSGKKKRFSIVTD